MALQNTFNDTNKISLEDLDDVLQTEIGKISGLNKSMDAVYPGATKVENLGNGKLKINDVEVVVYSHPSTHPASMITGLATIATTGSYDDLIGAPKTLPASDVYSWAKEAKKPTYTVEEIGAVSSDLVGVANGLATLDGDAKLELRYLSDTLQSISKNGIQQSMLPTINAASKLSDSSSKAVVLGGLDSSITSFNLVDQAAS